MIACTETLASQPRKTLNDLLTAYTADYLPYKSPRTQYQERLFYRWIGREMGEIALVDLSVLVLTSWRNSLLPYYTANTVRRYMISFSALLTKAVDPYGWLEKNPLHKVVKPKEPSGRERCLTPDEQSRLLASCWHSRNQHLGPLVVLALSTGCRKSELLERKWTDVDLRRKILSIPDSKNGDRRALPLIPQAVSVLEKHAIGHKHPWVFARADGKAPISITVAWRYALERAGIENFHFHDLRHTAGSHLAMSGASLREIAEILGHKTLKQSMKYCHIIEPHTRGVLTTMANQFLGDMGSKVLTEREYQLLTSKP